MTPFSGQALRNRSDGTAASEGPCQVTLAPDSVTVLGPGQDSFACDLGDIEGIEPGEYDLSLVLCTGDRIRFSHFGKTLQPLAQALGDAWRTRLIQCLLLDDLRELARFDVTASLESQRGRFASPAELRVYETNLAVLPLGASAFQWRLADVDRLEFDRQTFTLTLARGADRLSFAKVGRRSEECCDVLNGALARLQVRTLDALRTFFPFLAPQRLTEVSRLMREGRAAPMARLLAIDKRVEPALRANMADARLRPCFEVLAERSGIAGMYAGFRLIRPEEQGSVPAEEQQAAVPTTASASDVGFTNELEPVSDTPDESPDADSQVLCWFFFALSTRGSGHAPDTLAWEATSRTGRATYLFSLQALRDAGSRDADEAAATLDRAIGALNFRREPIYLPDQALDLEAKYHRYVIGARRIPELRDLRRAFRARVIHTSPAAWQKQLDAALVR
jgi:hypothetical protein